MTRPSPEVEAASNKRWLDAVPGRREAKHARDRQVKAAHGAALKRLATKHPNTFKKFYAEEAAKRGITVGKRGRPKVAS